MMIIVITKRCTFSDFKVKWILSAEILRDNEESICIYLSFNSNGWPLLRNLMCSFSVSGSHSFMPSATGIKHRSEFQPIDGYEAGAKAFTECSQDHHSHSKLYLLYGPYHHFCIDPDIYILAWKFLLGMSFFQVYVYYFIVLLLQIIILG